MPATRLPLLTLLAVLCGASAPGQEAALPFTVGERLSYDGSAGPGLRGQGEMWIDGPVALRGTPVMVLHFTFDARVGPLRVSDRTTSWLDPVQMSSLRFAKEERHLLKRRSEDVAIEPALRRWTAADGKTGAILGDAPLDELSFIYALRTITLAEDAETVVERHFDSERSPTTLKSLGRGTVTTPAGTFATREVEMRVRDARHYDGEGIIRVSLSDDACRRPVRIASRIPGAGSVVLTLRAAVPVIAACQPAAEAPGG